MGIGKRMIVVRSCHKLEYFHSNQKSFSTKKGEVYIFSYKKIVFLKYDCSYT